MHAILLLNIFALIIFVIQFFTGFFIDPDSQVLILSGVNVLFRIFVGRDLFHGGTIKATVSIPYDIKTKNIFTSKIFWLSVMAILGSAIQWRFGWVLEPQYYLIIVSSIISVVATITKKPIDLK